ncbi:MAG: 16S rRNA (cytosine(1402)-N(4))-methyltransferase RsmH [Bacteroidetes bacterium]|nr:16S rRNA (cytosine(1402)-N(4))-methyltransferase RsmH [Bacteroidota bacterium]MDA0944227.1 16S rRNA (cytosine(1402)-N(4))-methyltransferase RsmH [Bacteroidota bacterium]
MIDYHQPVLLTESVEALIQEPNGTYVDLTFGGGGHSRAILEKLGPKGKLIAFDQDSDAAARALNDSRFQLVQHNFRHTRTFLEYLNAAPVEGILGDLGISSHQIDVDHRGFAHRFDGPLDMRMDQDANFSAADLVNQYSEEELTRVFKQWGEMPNAKRLAREVAQFRKSKTIQSIADFKQAIEPCTPKLHPAKFYSPLFQALRIEVNKEMEALEQVLLDSEHLIREGGRLVMISYHSLEDRLVKNYLNSGNLEGIRHTNLYGWSEEPFKNQRSKPTLPSEEEIAQNNRARSAKMRVGIRNAWKKTN